MEIIIGWVYGYGIGFRTGLDWTGLDWTCLLCLCYYYYGLGMDGWMVCGIFTYLEFLKVYVDADADMDMDGVEMEKCVCLYGTMQRNGTPEILCSR